MEQELSNNKRVQLAENKLGNTNIYISRLGFGCASVWGKNLITDEEAFNLFEKAYEYGIRYFDTGFSYGCAEERIGKILRNSTVVNRSDIVISTKFGTRLIDGKYVHDWSIKWMQESIRISMSRMNIQYIDLLMCHGPSINELTEEFIEAMRKLKTSGCVRAIGINTFDTSVIEYVCDNKCFDFVMLDYNIMRQDREPLIKRLYENGIGVIAGAPLAESLFSNRVFKIKHKKDIWYLARAIKNHRDKIIQKKNYAFINKIDGATGSQIALKYVLDNSYVTTAVFGTTTLSHLEENIRAADVVIPDDIRSKIERQKKYGKDRK